MLMLGFLVVVAGVAIWLVLTGPAPVPDIAKPVTEPVTEPATKAVTETAAKTATKAPPSTSTPTKPPGSSDTIVKGAPEAEKIGAAPPPHSTAAEHNSPSSKTAESPAKAPPVTAESASDVTAAGQKLAHSPTLEKGATKPPASPAADSKPVVAKPAAEKPVVAKPAAKVATRTVVPKKLPRVAPDTPLAPSPDPALVQTTALGPLPRIGTDGRLPRKVYAKPFDTADKRPRVAIVVTGLGLSAAATESAIQGLPGSVTLAFAPYSNRLNEWIRLARAAGHEVLINVPMEPTNYPAYDPGPQTLLTSLNAEGNLDRLLWSLSRGTGYVGVVDFLGSRFTTSRNHMRPVLKAINDRGLLYLDSGSSPRSISGVVAREVNVAWAMATLTVDQRASRTEIDRKFGELEQRAKRDKRAIGIASPYPVTLERIANWVRQLEARGIAIAPVSALAQPAPAGRN